MRRGGGLLRVAHCLRISSCPRQCRAQAWHGRLALSLEGLLLSALLLSALVRTAPRRCHSCLVCSTPTRLCTWTSRAATVSRGNGAPGCPALAARAAVTAPGCWPAAAHPLLPCVHPCQLAPASLTRPCSPAGARWCLQDCRRGPGAQPAHKDAAERGGHDGHLCLVRGGACWCLTAPAPRWQQGQAQKSSKCSCTGGRAHAPAEKPPPPPRALQVCPRGAHWSAVRHRRRHLQLWDHALVSACLPTLHQQRGEAWWRGQRLPPAHVVAAHACAPCAALLMSGTCPAAAGPCCREIVTGEIPNRGTMRNPEVPAECPQVGPGAGPLRSAQRAADRPSC